MARLLAIVVVAAIIIVAIVNAKSGLSPTVLPATTANVPQAPAPSSLQEEAEAALKKVDLKFTIRRAGFDTVMIIDATIKNDNAFAIKDLDIACEVYGGSGTAIGSPRQRLYQTVKAKSTRTFKDINMGFVNPQSASARCKVKDFLPELAAAPK